ncbi:MAG: CheR family methyltransferase [Cyanobacteriota bacterium]
MSQAAIEILLKQKIGLDPNVIGTSTIARAIQQRLAACELPDTKAYLRRLQTSSQELDALIENLVVPETWFFRDREAYSYLSHYAKSQWLPTHPDTVLRVLSVPCSTGEEPLSIAIALLEAGLSSKHFSIDAVDISQKALHIAQQGIYGRNSFRGETVNFRQRYFTQVGNKYQVHEFVRSTINFIRGNLLQPLFFLEKTPYDVIFCRNVLIYFDYSAREQAIQVLDRLLMKKGVLFVGHSETSAIPPLKFVSVRHPLAFAFRKVAATEEVRQTKKPSARTTRRREQRKEELETGDNRQGGLLLKPGKQASRLADIPETTPSSLLSLDSQSPVKIKDNLETLLETAKNLADRGQLKEAATLCETYLSQNPVSAEAYVLLGQVRQAQGKEEQALQCFQKATYLNPNHYEALIHLALLKEYTGDSKGAAMIRHRIQRLTDLSR